MKILFTIILLALLLACGKQKNNTLTLSTEVVADKVQTETPILDSANIIPNIEQVHRHEDSVLQELGMKCIDEVFPEVFIDIKYATEDNFLGIDFYNGFNRAYAQDECIAKFGKAVQLLNAYDSTLHFVIFDAARSIEAQQLMWDSVEIEGFNKINFVANPQRGSIHNYGMALDLGLADSLGNYLDMGTPYDYFGELAFPYKSEHFYTSGKLTVEQYNNRCLLMQIMREAGFYVSKTEWWHYNACSLKTAKEKYNIYRLNN